VTTAREQALDMMMTRSAVFVLLAYVALVVAQSTTACTSSSTAVICENTMCQEAVSACSAAASCILNQCGDSCQPTLYNGDGAVVTSCPAAPAPSPTNTVSSVNPTPSIIACGGAANAGGTEGGNVAPQSAATSVECPVCQYGHQLGSNGCPTCTCNSPPVCNEACVVLDAPNCAAILPPSDGRCCPTCVPPTNCTDRACPLIACAISTTPNVDTYTYSDGCCTYCGQLNCTAVRAAGKCVLPDCPAGQAAWIAPGECCPQCTPTVKCAQIACVYPTCGPDQKMVRSDDSCCPFCAPNDPNPCEHVACPDIACPDGSTLSPQDGACCGICMPISTCNRTLCYDYTSVCHPVLQSIRDGDCCSSCSPCRVIEGLNGNNIVCTANDDTLCRPGFTPDANSDCTVSVPVVSACFDVQVDVVVLPSLDPTVSNQTVLKYAIFNALSGEAAAAVRAALPLLNVTIKSTTVVSGNSKTAVLTVCFTVPASADTTNPSTNPSTLSNQTSSNLFVTNGFSAAGSTTAPTSAPTSTSTSSASTLVASVIALGVVVLAL
jgi:hypothetical protein